MLGIFSIPLFFTIFQVVTSQIPPHCRGPPPGVEKPGECCKIPRVFSEDDFKECDIEDPSNYKIRGPPDCSKHICLLKRYNLMKDDENVDKEAIATFLDKWVDKNAEFKDAVEKAKDRCLSEDLPGPPQICEPNKIGFCVMITTFNECPTWEDSDKCKKLKEHIDECKAYFPF